MRRSEAIAYLTNHGRDEYWVPCSRYGRTTSDCAPVAYRVAYLLARETDGGPVTPDQLDHAMGLVVNNHDDVAYLVRQYGHRKYT